MICVVIALAVLLAAGLTYAYVITHTNLSFRCMIHSFTGLLCPGCGVTHMCLSLLHGDWTSAFSYNPVLMVLLPVLAMCLTVCAVRYVRTGSGKPPRWMERILWICAAVLLAFGVIRNIV